ncbi:MAG TPA: 50S ribosomal protein L11 methyltransferase, partial [Rhodanobacteraceae bacterium]
MAWLELSVIVAADQQAAVEAAFEELGALAVTLLDAEDHPIFEPAPGETPMWPQIAMSALFESGSDRIGLVHVLTELVPELAPERLGFRNVEDQDWTRAWMDQFQPMRFGRRLWIYPWNVEPPVD